MPQAAIVALLRHSIGVNPDAIGPEVIARAVRQRMVQCSASDLQTYLERIQTSEQELHALIEAVVVPETWFFRDQIPFAYLGRYVTAEWLPVHQHAVFRVLSLACSTGEEPYSIAMALLDSGLAPQHVRIDAVTSVLRPYVRRGEPCTGAIPFVATTCSFGSAIASRASRGIASASASGAWSHSGTVTFWTRTC